MDWKITITKVDNGFLLESPREAVGQVEEEVTGTDREVIEVNLNQSDVDSYETDDEDKICIARMLERVAEYFGTTYDKYGKDNLNIKFNTKGHKTDD